MVSCQSLRMQRDVAEDVGEHVVGHPRFNMAMGPRNPKTHEFFTLLGDGFGSNAIPAGLLMG